MNNHKRIIRSLAFIILLSVSLLSIPIAKSQTPPPPNNGDGNNVDGNTPVGGGAPLTDGLIMLISGGIIYLCYTEKDQIISLFKSNH